MLTPAWCVVAWFMREPLWGVAPPADRRRRKPVKWTVLAADVSRLLCVRALWPLAVLATGAAVMGKATLSTKSGAVIGEKGRASQARSTSATYLGLCSWRGWWRWRWC